MPPLAIGSNLSRTESANDISNEEQVIR